MSDEQESEPLLSVRDLAVHYATEAGPSRAVDGVSFDVPRGRTVALVGESGCGKTSTALAILRLLSPAATIAGGRVLLRGEDLLRLSPEEMQSVRGAKVAMIFQDPLAALNPVHTIGAQIVEAIRAHQSISRGAARARAMDLLRDVGSPGPEERFGSYPHELSGGMRQRVLIAMALAAGPALLVADEPTSALDTTVEAQILSLLEDLRVKLSMSLLIIAHDLLLVGEIAHEVVVLYAGVVVERGAPSRILREPRHPYTRALLRSLPPAGSYRARGERRLPLAAIEGAPPDLRDPPPGCRFHPRCPEVMGRCRAEAPPLVDLDGGAVRCFLYAPLLTHDGAASGPIPPAPAEPSGGES